MATVSAVWYNPALTPSGASYDLYAIVDYTTSTTDTSVTVTVQRVRIGDYTLSGGSVSVSLSGSTVGSWSGLSGSSTKTINTSKSITRGHSSSSTSISVRISGTVGESGYRGTGSASGSVSISVPARSSYTVTYNANGGSGAPSSQTKWYGESLTLSSGKPYRSGYQFWHWNTSSSNSGTNWFPSETYNGNSSLYLYAIWNPIITYNANGGSGAPASQTKTYNQSITLSSVKPQRTGYEFLGWGTSSSSTSASYQPSQTYTSNSSLSLYAVWRKVAVPPTISSMKVIRCNSSGTSDTSGTYCKVTASWSVDTSGAGMSANYGTVTGSISDGGTTRSFTITSGAGGSGITSATATAIVSGCSTDVQYTVTITVRNNKIGSGQSSYLSTSRSDILTRAFFTMDFAAGGRGIGMGVAAPTAGFECGFDTTFNNTVTVKGAFLSPNTVVGVTATVSNVLSSVSGSPITILSVYAKRVGYLASLHIYMSTTRIIEKNEYFSFATVNSGFAPEEDYAFVVMPYVNQVSFVYFSSSTLKLSNPFGTISSDRSFVVNITYCLRVPYNATIS